MKTYWLIKHEHRPSVRRKSGDEFLEIEPDHPLPSTSCSTDKMHEEKDKRIYSPITFHDVRARFSISEVPVNNNLNKTKGNSRNEPKYSLGVGFRPLRYCWKTIL